MYLRQLPVLASVLFLNIANADDTDLYVKKISGAALPNVLLIMDTSGSMGISAGSKSRMEVAKDAARDFVQTAENINISLMSFNYDAGGKVDFASENIETGRQGAINVINGYSAGGLTPLSETFYEAYLYFTGQRPHFGDSSYSASMNGSDYLSPVIDQCQKSSIVLFTDGEPFYDSDANTQITNLLRPLRSSMPHGLNYNCIGDGVCLDELAWWMFANDVNWRFPGKQNVNTFTIAGFGGAPPGLLTSAAHHGGGRYYEANNSSELSQALNDILLQVNAESSSFSAPATSVSAFNSLETAEDIYYIVFKPGAGPAWKGNLKRYRLGDDNNIYDANGNLAIDPATGFFSEQAKSFWSSIADGNDVEQGGMAEQLSHSRPVFTNISGDVSVPLSSMLNRVEEGNDFIDSEILGTTSSSERHSVLRWARGLDVDDENGDGFDFNNRKSIGEPLHTQPYILTYYKNSAGQTDKSVFFTTNDGFVHSVNADNGRTEFSFIPKDLLANLRIYRDKKVRPPVPASGPTSDSQCVWNYQIPGACVPARWCRYDYEFGDIYLSQSCRVFRPPQSDDDCNWDGWAAKCANLDYCEYRFKWGDGNLSESCRLRSDRPSPPPEPKSDNSKIYGMDGPMSAWIADHNGDGDLLTGFKGSVDSGEHAFLYLTMRRGGSNIYSLDVTDRNNPVLKWVIRGDLNFDRKADSLNDNPDFSELGQTWSKVKVTRVKWQGRERQVLLFGGGYDEDADFQSLIEDSDIGRAIYMVDAETGELLWSAGRENGTLIVPDMKYSIPAELTLVDINQDGLTDYLYAVDIGGQLLRMDINANNTYAGNFATVGVIARLSEYNSYSDTRRFFEAPAVSLSKNRDYLHIAVGSGTRPTPMENMVHDRMYVIRDRNIFHKPSSYRYAGGNIITESSLYDATANIIQHGNEFQKKSELARLAGSHGWYLRLQDSGEKVLSKATMLNGVLMFNSFVPQFSSNSCAPGVGVNYFYALDLEDGRAVLHTQNSGNQVKRRMLLKSKSLAPTPSVISRGGEMKVCVGSQCLDGNNLPIQEIGNRVKRSFWRENR